MKMYAARNEGNFPADSMDNDNDDNFFSDEDDDDFFDDDF